MKWPFVSFHSFDLSDRNSFFDSKTRSSIVSTSLRKLFCLPSQGRFKTQCHLSPDLITKEPVWLHTKMSLTSKLFFLWTIISVTWSVSYLLQCCSTSDWFSQQGLFIYLGYFRSPEAILWYLELLLSLFNAILIIRISSFQSGIIFIIIFIIIIFINLFIIINRCMRF